MRGGEVVRRLDGEEITEEAVISASFATELAVARRRDRMSVQGQTVGGPRVDSGG